MYRIISYNIHSGVGTDKRHDYRRIGRFLAEQRADIVLLQEMDTRAPDREIESDIRDICADKVFELVPSPALVEPSGWYGNALLTRFPVIAQHTLDVSQQGVQPRNIQTVELMTPQGPLTVINTHKGLTKKERRSQFRKLHEYIASILATKPSPVILGGDFNEWQFFTRAFRHLDKVMQQHKVGATFPSVLPLFSLDRFWTSPDIRLTRIKKLRNRQTKILSDHLPVQADICLPLSLASD
ncbi:endonuclease/exonuclease/phosphatase family protein [Aestuariibacter sp. A3R04]|uniref:endonuclease/exonuclease/phosphatase family protein n=1 Tax=Aestuariibacter sp. A3R04 TaxID=2841571 RepID=UPI001C09DA71|nr:endonuclease/exonuclease/phosphatase family protein [Aestuariibacter sp. A3R04]MBU3021179.1 endonuclease/exonuclease/phosphatase family protein [Aestuariibacter sp. A3R04]